MLTLPLWYMSEHRAQSIYWVSQSPCFDILEMFLYSWHAMKFFSHCNWIIMLCVTNFHIKKIESFLLVWHTIKFYQTLRKNVYRKKKKGRILLFWWDQPQLKKDVAYSKLYDDMTNFLHFYHWKCDPRSIVYYSVKVCAWELFIDIKMSFVGFTVGVQTLRFK